MGRTGTHSLKVALEQLLGGPCHHMVEVFAHQEQIPVWTDAIEGRPVDWPQLMSDYVAQVDWPGASFWPELLEAYPDALVLLSVRDPEAWYKSTMETIFLALGRTDEEIGPWMVAIKRLLGDRFSNRFADRAAMIAAFERHNDEVRVAGSRRSAARVDPGRRVGADLRPARPGGPRRALPGHQHDRGVQGHDGPAGCRLSRLS